MLVVHPEHRSTPPSVYFSFLYETAVKTTFRSLSKRPLARFQTTAVLLIFWGGSQNWIVPGDQLLLCVSLCVCGVERVDQQCHAYHDTLPADIVYFGSQQQ